MAKRKRPKKRESVDEILARMSERMYPDQFGQAVVTLNSREADGDSAVHNLLYGRDAPTAKTLIDAGADVNMAGNVGFTPLHVAAWTNNPRRSRCCSPQASTQMRAVQWARPPWISRLRMAALTSPKFSDRSHQRE